MVTHTKASNIHLTAATEATQHCRRMRRRGKMRGEGRVKEKEDGCRKKGNEMKRAREVGANKWKQLTHSLI